MKQGIDYPGVSVAFFCHDGNGKFAFHLREGEARSHTGTWDNGGGGLEFGETLEEALFRELKEEYCCTGVIEERLEPNSFIQDENGVTHHWIVHPFIVRVNPEELKLGEPHKASNLSWHALHEPPTPLHPGVANDIEMYKEVFKKYC